MGLVNDDVFIVKYDVLGTYMGVSTLGDAGVDQGWGIALNPVNQDVIITGTFSGTVDFDFVGTNTRTVTGADTDGFIVSYSSLGVLNWVNQIGSGGSGVITGNENVASVRVLNNRIFVTGYYHNSTCDFNPATAGIGHFAPPGMTWGARDIFVASYNLTTGAYFWNTTIGGTGLDNSADLVIDPTARLYVVANYRSAAISSFPAGIAEANAAPGTYNFVVFSLNSATGVPVWWEGIGGAAAGDDVATCIEWDGLNLYVGGYYTGAVTFNPTAAGAALFPATTGWVSSGAQDMFLARFRTGSGVCSDIASMGSTGNDRVQDIYVDVTTSRVYATGTFQNTVDADPDPAGGAIDNMLNSGVNIDNAFLSKYDYFVVPALVLNTPDLASNPETITGEEVLGEEELVGEEITLNVYPNPTNGALYIDRLTAGSVIEIYNVSGGLVRTWSVEDEGKMTLDLSEITNGIYLVNVKTQDGAVMTTKLIKQ